MPLLSVLALLCPSLAGVASAGVHTWTTNGPAVGDITALAIDPSAPATLYAGTNLGGAGFGFFKSTDGGGSWTLLSAAPDAVIALAIDLSAPATLYAANVSFDTGDGLSKSTDGGESWTDSSPNVRVFAVAIDPSNSATLYAGTTGPGEVFKSTDPTTPGGAKGRHTTCRGDLAGVFSRRKGTTV